MATRIIVGLVVLLAIVQAVVPNAPADVLVPLLVILGLAYAAIAINAEDATAFLVVAVAVGASANADVLNHIPAVGGHLDAIVGHISTALYSGVATVLAVRTVNRLKG